MKPMFCRHKYFDLLAAGIVGYAVSLIVAACDRVITGFFFGIEGLSALAVVDPLSSIVGFAGVLIIFGIRFVYPTEVGKKNQERANQYFSCALTAAIIVSIIFLVAITALGNAYFDFQSLSPEYLAYAQDYFFFAKYVFILQPITGLLGAVIFTDGNPKVIRRANLFYVVANIVLSIVFAYFFGMKGIGLGTLVGGLACFGIQCTHFFSKKCTLKYRPYLSLRDMADMARYGIAEASYSIFSGINGVLINWFIIKYLGEPYLAAHSVVGYSMCLCCFFGGCQASMVPLLNVYYGEGNRDGMLKILKVTLMSSVAIGLVLTVVALVAAPVFPILFSVESEEITRVIIEGVRISSLGFSVTGILGVVTRYYNALGRNILATVLSIMKDTVIFLALFFACSALFGVTGMWICNLLQPIVAAPLFFIIVRIAIGRKNSKNILLLPDPESTIKSWDFSLSLDAVMEICEKIRVYLTEQGKTPREINRARFLTEEYCMSVLDANPGKKVVMEIAIIENAEGGRIIFRDSGVVDDITNEDRVSSFRSYVLTNFSEMYDSREYMKVSGYNRKEYALTKKDRVEPNK